VKLLHVIPTVELGGAERLLVELVGGQLARGDEVTVASSGGRLEDDLRRAGARVVRVALQERSLGRTVLASLALARTGSQPDIVHSHNVRAALAARLGAAGPRRGVPHVVTVHGISQADSRLSAPMLSIVADAVVAVAQNEARQLRASGLRVPVVVIPNAVAAPVKRNREEARRRLGIDGRMPVALCIARLAKVKRHDLLLEAWARVPASALLLCAGEGPLLADLEQQTERLGLMDRVRFLGPRSDVDWLLSASDLVTLASDREGLPMAVLEAMAAGLPVVATRVGGLPELVMAGAGLLVPPGDASALAAALSLMLEDAGRRRGAGSSGRAHVQRRYSIEALVDAYADVYGALLPGAAGTEGVQAGQ